jgi:hypothetical protein
MCTAHQAHALNHPRRWFVSLYVKGNSSFRRLNLRFAGVLAFIAAGVVVFVLTTPTPLADPGAAIPPPPPEPPTTTKPSSTVPSTTPPTSTAMSIRFPPAPMATEVLSEGPVFPAKTNVVLLFDDGLSGLTALDPDRGLAARSLVQGQRPGDQPYRLLRVGNKLVAGWGEPHAVDVITRQGVSLGIATIFLPAAEPGRVWMIDSGSRIGARAPVVWQVEVESGTPMHDPIPLNVEGGFPLIGIPGGLALQTMSGLALWLMETGEKLPLEADSPGFTVDVHGELLVWCDDPCSRLAITSTSSLATTWFDPPEGYDTFLLVGQFSPNGRYLAVLVGANGVYEGRGLWILDLETGEINVVSNPETPVSDVGWAPDGDQLFATSFSYGGNQTAVWRYQVSEQSFQAVVLPLSGAVRLVVIDSSEADAYFGEALPG